MPKIRLFFRSTFKWIVALLAVCNLIALFVFNYQLPGFIQSRLPFQKQETPVSQETSSSVSSDDTAVSGSWQIQVPEEALVYDGTGSLNLSEGVTVLDGSGEKSSVQPTVLIKAGSSSREKIIEYSVTDDQGKDVSVERTLTLGSSYDGPSIVVSGDLPPFSTTDELDNIVSIMMDEEILHAEDGFGRDISSSVTATATPNGASGDYLVALNVVNMLNDTCTIYLSVHVQNDTPTSGPVLELTTDQVTISAGSNFEYLEYIQTAKAEDGTDLYHNISVNGSVDTSTPGQYVLEIYCSDNEGNISPIKKLTVNVQ